MRIQLLTFPGCANADAARALLSRVLGSNGNAHGFEEVDTHAPATPESYRAYASPTILVDGVPVGGEGPGQGVWGACSCRLYVGEDGRLGGLPTETAVRSALAHATRSRAAAT